MLGRVDPPRLPYVLTVVFPLARLPFRWAYSPSDIDVGTTHIDHHSTPRQYANCVIAVIEVRAFRTPYSMHAD